MYALTSFALTVGDKCIADVAAKILMPLFYHYYSKGEPPTYALQKAQLQYIQKLRKLNNAAPPSLWAPFLLQGTNTQAM